MTDSLIEKTIFITGSAGVLGSAYIETLLNNGATVIASDIPSSRTELIKERFEDNSKFAYYDLDVSNEREIELIFKKIQSDGLKPNVVLNNAAITGELLMGAGQSFPDFASTSVSDWEKTLRVNLTGAFMVARQMDRDIVGRYPAKLINVASIYGLNGPHHNIYETMPFKPFSAYSATKAGIHGLTLWLAGYWAPRNCTVNTISPGAVYNGHSEEFQKRVGQFIMSGRMANPQEIANVMLFLCSENSNYMTGQIVNVDGGYSGW